MALRLGCCRIMIVRGVLVATIVSLVVGSLQQLFLLLLHMLALLLGKQTEPAGSNVGLHTTPLTQGQGPLLGAFVGMLLAFVFFGLAVFLFVAFDSLDILGVPRTVRLFRQNDESAAHGDVVGWW